MNSVRDLLQLFALFVLPLLIVGIPVIGLIRRVPIYEAFVEGAKEGFKVAVIIIPYLVAILFAIGMFRASGAMDALANVLAPVLDPMGIPSEILPMAIVRPLTGGGSVGVLAEMANTYGTDSVYTRIAAVISGATETTFYVIAVYFGAVNIKKTRHAVPVGLLADLMAILLAVYIVKHLFS